jgi:hypothetical protein
VVLSSAGWAWPAASKFEELGCLATEGFLPVYRSPASIVKEIA